MKQQVWDSLTENYSKHNERQISSLFEEKTRFKNFSAEGAGLFIDFSKTNIDHAAKDLLIQLIKKSNVLNKREQMFSGEIINESENRAVLHFALRGDYKNLGERSQGSIRSIAKARSQMEKFA